MSEKNGGPAFPRHTFADDDLDGESYVVSSGGMSLRDYFAAAALPQAIEHERSLRAASIKPDKFRYSEIAEAAYKMADAMLAAREAQ
jgi:hypothetical protein